MHEGVGERSRGRYIEPELHVSSLPTGLALKEPNTIAEQMYRQDPIADLLEALDIPARQLITRT
jgi:hypothetical protein